MLNKIEYVKLQHEMAKLVLVSKANLCLLIYIKVNVLLFFSHPYHKWQKFSAFHLL